MIYYIGVSIICVRITGFSAVTIYNNYNYIIHVVEIIREKNLHFVFYNYLSWKVNLPI